MKRFAIVVVSKEYRYVEVEAQDEAEAEDQVWTGIENILNRKPEDYDTEVYVEGYQEITVN